MKTAIILGNQLFDPKILKKNAIDTVFMAESMDLCTKFRYHKSKIFLYLSAMRHYRDELLEAGFDVFYSDIETEKKLSFLGKFSKYAKKKKLKSVAFFEIEDRFMEQEVSDFLTQENISSEQIHSPMFMTSREEFSDYLGSVKKPMMRTFYERRRKSLGVLMNEKSPVGGKYSFDSENRKKLPKDYKSPKSLDFTFDQIDEEVISDVSSNFPQHPGTDYNTKFPRTRADARKLLKQFVKVKLECFGHYQDSISGEHRYMNHSLVSTSINLGLLDPGHVVDVVHKAFVAQDLPLNSVEGFIRQVMGWREFVRGIYQNFNEKMDQGNFWGHNRLLKDCWYDGTTGIPPLDDAIITAKETGYNHHIERLMILANYMNLCELEPREAYRWFMEHHVDSSDWVMAPNVYGMGLMSDGGVFATKPYICGSNYLLKMSRYKKGEWCDISDGLYWRFIKNNRKFFASNPRMSIMIRGLDRMDEERKTTLFETAEKFIDRVTNIGK